MNKWTPAQQDQAAAQGWGVFALDGDPARLVIQRLDEAEVFAEDGAALAFVVEKAQSGDPLCQAALDACSIQWEHNYRKKLNSMIALGQLPRGTSVTQVSVYHDDWCGIYSDKLCNCDPDIKLKVLWTRNN